ncbi:MAG: ATP-binding protein [Caldilineae bacterium]|nr:MAG: ATP-binding protein [Caldilineae bacterium]
MDDRYPITFRAEITPKLMAEIQQGSCACIVGLAGVGKSNLVRFMQKPETLRHYIKGSSLASRIHILNVDCSPGDQPRDELYREMDAAVRELIRVQGWPLPFLDAEATPFETLRSRLRFLCQEKNLRVVFVLDEFEAVLRKQPAGVLEDLRRLRDDHRERANLLFIVITHILPHLVAHNPPIRETKFFELIGERIYALGPYSRADVESMLDARMQIKGADPRVLTPAQRNVLYDLSGGHSRLLRALFDEYYPMFPATPQDPGRLLREMPGVGMACQHVWTHLHMDEQNLLLTVVQGRVISPTAETYLRKRGLLRPGGRGLELFSPLFREYVRTL